MKHEATSLYGMSSSSRCRKDIRVMRSLAPNCLAFGLSKPFGSMMQICEVTPSPLGICHNILPHNGVEEILITRRCLAVEHVFIQTEANGAQESSSLSQFASPSARGTLSAVSSKPATSGLSHSCTFATTSSSLHALASLGHTLL